MCAYPSIRHILQHNALPRAAHNVAISRLYKREPSQGLEPWTPSLPFKSPRRNRRARMTPQVPQIQANRANERSRGFSRGDAPCPSRCAHGVRTRWSAGMARSGAPSVAVCDVLLGRRGAAWWDPCTAERVSQDARRQALRRRARPLRRVGRARARRDRRRSDGLVRAVDGTVPTRQLEARPTNLREQPRTGRRASRSAVSGSSPVGPGRRGSSTTCAGGCWSRRARRVRAGRTRRWCSPGCSPSGATDTAPSRTSNAVFGALSGVLGLAWAPHGDSCARRSSG